MMKGITNDGVLLFGLSARNVELLKEGKPIDIDLRTLGLPSGRVLIFYGETEQEIRESLIVQGLIDENTKEVFGVK